MDFTADELIVKTQYHPDDRKYAVTIVIQADPETPVIAFNTPSFGIHYRDAAVGYCVGLLDMEVSSRDLYGVDNNPDMSLLTTENLIDCITALCEYLKS